ncbi:MAG TPA: glycosyltransferase, partial [Waddliaceae bacterium]
MKGRINVVVPSFNSVDFLPRTLQSIESQTCRNFDVCIIDDGSTIIRQPEIIRDYCSRNKWKAIYHKENEGALK